MWECASGPVIKAVLFPNREYRAIEELRRLDKELGTLKWAGSDSGWDAAIAAVRKHLDVRVDEIYNPPDGSTPSILDPHPLLP